MRLVPTNHNARNALLYTGAREFAAHVGFPLDRLYADPENAAYDALNRFHALPKDEKARKEKKAIQKKADAEKKKIAGGGASWSPLTGLF